MARISLKEKQRSVLKALRKEKGISIKELSDKVKIETTRVQRLESGNYEMMVSECVKLEAFYQVDIYSSLRKSIHVCRQNAPVKIAEDADIDQV